jgi:hypothetical protein
MDLTAWTVYWITRLDKVHFVLEVFILFLSFIFIFLFIFKLTEGKAPYVWATGLALSFVILMKVFTPTTTEFAAIIVLPALAQNQDIKEIGAEIPKLAREWLQELHPKQKD